MIYLFCLIFVTLFGPKALRMTPHPSYDRPVTWGDVTASFIVGLIPWFSALVGVLIIYCYLKRGWHYLRLKKFFNTPVFKQKD